jgi:hypothetical protein
MEFHYTVMYDDKVKAWSVEPDPSMYYPDGNIYNRDMSDDPFPYTIYPGWFFPEKDSADEALDYNLYLTLQSIVHTFPVPEEVS